MTILLVDDNQVNLFVIEKILKNAGYEHCVSLSSANELFDYLQLNEPNPTGSSVDLILLDIMMPEVDGMRPANVLSKLKD